MRRNMLMKRLKTLQLDLMTLRCLHNQTSTEGHSEAGASGGSTKRYGRKRKQADVLERMADHIQQSSADQRKNAQLLADAIVGVNEKFKVGEKLTQLGFDDEEVVKAILKFAESPNVHAHF
ncbi:hypothetical protein HN51_039970 [Arachis hypogaea]